MNDNSRHTKTLATTTTTVNKYEAVPYEQPSVGPALTAVHLEETFAGDVTGKGVAQVLQAINPDGSLTFVTIERVEGEIAGRHGSFLLQVTGTVVDQHMHAKWFVIVGSATNELEGLRGTGGFEATLGKSGHATLTYWFE